MLLEPESSALRAGAWTGPTASRDNLPWTLMSATLFSSTMRPRWPTLQEATLIVVVAGLLWRTVRYALAFPLWGDEAYRRHQPPHARPGGAGTAARVFPDRAARLPLGRMARRLTSSAPANGRCGWSRIWRAWRRCLLFWRFCREVASRRTVLLAVAVLAASFYPVRHSTEVKPYAIDLLVSLMLISTGWAAGRDIRSYRAWLALFAVTIVGVWCSYTAVFPAAGVALFLGARVVRERSIRLAALWLTYGLLMTLSWGIVFVAFASPQARAADFLPHLETWNDAFPPLAEPWRLPWWLLEVHTGNMLAYPYGGNNFGSTLTTILVVAGCIRMGRRRVRRPLLFLLLGPLPVALIAAALHRYPYGTSTRVMLYMAPAFCLLIGEGIMALLAASSLDEPRAVDRGRSARDHPLGLHGLQRGQPVQSVR